MSGPLPKIELHCHLDGILDTAMLSTATNNKYYGSPIPPGAIEALPIAHDLESFFEWFKIVNPYFVGHLERFFFIIAQHIERLVSQRVIYSELMISKSEMANDRFQLVEQFSRLRELTNQLERGLVQIEFLIALGRNKSPEAVDEQAERVLLLHEKGLVKGVALAGPEEGFPVRPFEKTFDKLHESGMGIEIHAGEWAGRESVLDAMEYGHPHRLGHGLAAFESPELLKMIEDRGIHLEFCPTGNVRLTKLRRIEEHPIARALERGLSFSINTDDPGPLGVTMESEFALVKETFGFTEADFEKVRINSANAAFATIDRVIDLPSSER